MKRIFDLKILNAHIFSSTQWQNIFTIYMCNLSKMVKTLCFSCCAEFLNLLTVNTTRSLTFMPMGINFDINP